MIALYDDPLKHNRLANAAEFKQDSIVTRTDSKIASFSFQIVSIFYSLTKHFLNQIGNLPSKLDGCEIKPVTLQMHLGRGFYSNFFMKI